MGLARLDHRATAKKEIVASVLERAGIKKITEADFTLSLRSTNPPLVVIEEKQIPEEFWKPQTPKLDRQGLLSALKDGLDVPGVNRASYVVANRAKHITLSTYSLGQWGENQVINGLFLYA